MSRAILARFEKQRGRNSMSRMITGAHVIIYSRRSESDRAFLREVLGLSGVDIGDGWLIFALPPAELAIHPASRAAMHELYFMCADIDTFVVAMEKKHVRCDPIRELSWGRLTHIKLPGGGKLGVYQPLHARPKAVRGHTIAATHRSARKKKQGKQGEMF